MEQDLLGLLNVSETDVSGLLEEYKPQRCICSPDIPISFFYIKFQDGIPRTNHFVAKLCDNIIHFCLKREKQRSLNAGNARRLLLEAKQRFSQPSNGRTGEPGELILFFLLEGHLRAPKIFTKMNRVISKNSVEDIK